MVQRIVGLGLIIIGALLALWEPSLGGTITSAWGGALLALLGLVLRFIYPSAGPSEPTYVQVYQPNGRRRDDRWDTSVSQLVRLHRLLGSAPSPALFDQDLAHEIRSVALLLAYERGAESDNPSDFDPIRIGRQLAISWDRPLPVTVADYLYWFEQQDYPLDQADFVIVYQTLTNVIARYRSAPDTG